MVVGAGRARVGVLAVTDHPAEYAAEPGRRASHGRTCGRDFRSGCIEELERLRAAADLVVAFPHWGPNMTTEPARWQRRRARELVRGGRGSDRRPLGSRLPRVRAGRGNRSSTTSATRSTTMRSTSGCETTSGSSRCGGRAPIPDRAGRPAARLLRDRGRRGRRRGLDRGAVAARLLTARHDGRARERGARAGRLAARQPESFASSSSRRS